jgi:hypothetical protein
MPAAVAARQWQKHRCDRRKQAGCEVSAMEAVAPNLHSNMHAYHTMLWQYMYAVAVAIGAQQH